MPDNTISQNNTFESPSITESSPIADPIRS